MEETKIEDEKFVVEGLTKGEQAKDLTVEEAILFIEDVNRKLQENNKTKLCLKNVNIPSNINIAKLMGELGKVLEEIEIQDSTIGNLESLVQTMSGKENLENHFLRDENTIRSFSYNKNEKKMMLDVENTYLVRDLCEYIEPEELDILMYEESDKFLLAKNMKAIREANIASIKVKDMTIDETLEDIEKYENYANGNIVVFQSELLKRSLGLDKLPTKSKGLGSYHIKLDGSLLSQEEYKIQGEEAKKLLVDLREVSENVNVGKITLKGIEMSEHSLLQQGFANIFEQVNGIEVENSRVPKLQEILSNMDNKEKLEELVIRNSGVELGDIENISEFTNLTHINIGNEEKLEESKWQVKVKPSLWMRIKDFAKEKFPFLARHLDRDIKALPAGNSKSIENVYNKMEKEIEQQGENSLARQAFLQDIQVNPTENDIKTKQAEKAKEEADISR